MNYTENKVSKTKAEELLSKMKERDAKMKKVEYRIDERTTIMVTKKKRDRLLKLKNKNK